MTSAYLACLLASLQAYNLVVNQSDLVTSKLIKFYANVSQQKFILGETRRVDTSQMQFLILGHHVNGQVLTILIERLNFPWKNCDTRVL